MGVANRRNDKQVEMTDRKRKEIKDLKSNENLVVKPYRKGFCYDVHTIVHWEGRTILGSDEDYEVVSATTASLNVETAISYLSHGK